MVISRNGKRFALLSFTLTRFMNCQTRPHAPLRSSRSLPSSLSSSTVRTSHPRLRFVSPSKTARFSLSTIPSKNRPSSIATRHSTSMDPRAPEPDPNSVEDFVHIEDPNPNVESLSESFVGVDVAREDDADEADEAAFRSGGEGDSEGSNRRRALPEELSRSVVVLTCESSAEGGTCDVYLVGTAHVSEESCREVEAVISYLKPQVVFLELCPSRVALLTPQNLKVPTFGEMVEMYKKKHNAFGILYSWFLAKVANKLDVYPGAEFRIAFEEAMKYGGKVILGDRPIQVTLRRTWGNMPLWHKTKLIYSLLFQAVFLPSPEDLNKMLKDLDDVDMLTLVIQEMSKEFPTLMETLVHERDQYMSCTLLKVAREHSTVVAVVGKGHLAGIKKHWQQPVAVKDLLEVPSKKPAVSTVKMISSLGIAVAGVAILSGIYFGWKK